MFTILLLSFLLGICGQQQRSYEEHDFSVVAQKHFCPSTYEPICAYNGQKYEIFQNRCKLDKQNYQESLAERQVYAKRSFALCQPKCTVCPDIEYKVCVLDMQTQLLREFKSPCEVEYNSCKHGNYYRFLNYGTCSRSSTISGTQDERKNVVKEIPHNALQTGKGLPKNKQGQEQLSQVEPNSNADSPKDFEEEGTVQRIRNSIEKIINYFRNPSIQNNNSQRSSQGAYRNRFKSLTSAGNVKSIGNRRNVYNPSKATNTNLKSNEENVAKTYTNSNKRLESSSPSYRSLQIEPSHTDRNSGLRNHQSLEEKIISRGRKVNPGNPGNIGKRRNVYVPSKTRITNPQSAEEHSSQTNEKSENSSPNSKTLPRGSVSKSSYSAGNSGLRNRQTIEEISTSRNRKVDASNAGNNGKRRTVVVSNKARITDPKSHEENSITTYDNSNQRSQHIPTNSRFTDRDPARKTSSSTGRCGLRNPLRNEETPTLNSGKISNRNPGDLNDDNDEDFNYFNSSNRRILNSSDDVDKNTPENQSRLTSNTSGDNVAKNTPKSQSRLKSNTSGNKGSLRQFADPIPNSSGNTGRRGVLQHRHNGNSDSQTIRTNRVNNNIRDTKLGPSNQFNSSMRSAGNVEFRGSADSQNREQNITSPTKQRRGSTGISNNFQSENVNTSKNLGKNSNSSQSRSLTCKRSGNNECLSGNTYKRGQQQNGDSAKQTSSSRSKNIALSKPNSINLRNTGDSQRLSNSQNQNNKSQESNGEYPHSAGNLSKITNTIQSKPTIPHMPGNTGKQVNLKSRPNSNPVLRSRRNFYNPESLAKKTMTFSNSGIKSNSNQRPNGRMPDTSDNYDENRLINPARGLNDGMRGNYNIASNSSRSVEKSGNTKITNQSVKGDIKDIVGSLSKHFKVAKVLDSGLIPKTDTNQGSSSSYGNGGLSGNSIQVSNNTAAGAVFHGLIYKYAPTYHFFTAPNKNAVSKTLSSFLGNDHASALTQIANAGGSNKDGRNPIIFNHIVEEHQERQGFYSPVEEHREHQENQEQVHIKKERQRFNSRIEEHRKHQKQVHIRKNQRNSIVFNPIEEGHQMHQGFYSPMKEHENHQEQQEQVNIKMNQSNPIVFNPIEEEHQEHQVFYSPIEEHPEHQEHQEQVQIKKDEKAPIAYNPIEKHQEHQRFYSPMEEYREQQEHQEQVQFRKDERAPIVYNPIEKHQERQRFYRPMEEHRKHEEQAYIKKDQRKAIVHKPIEEHQERQALFSPTEEHREPQEQQEQVHIKKNQRNPIVYNPIQEQQERQAFYSPMEEHREHQDLQEQVHIKKRQKNPTVYNPIEEHHERQAFYSPMEEHRENQEHQEQVQIKKDERAPIVYNPIERHQERQRFYSRIEEHREHQGQAYIKKEQRKALVYKPFEEHEERHPEIHLNTNQIPVSPLLARPIVFKHFTVPRHRILKFVHQPANLEDSVRQPAMLYNNEHSLKPSISIDHRRLDLQQIPAATLIPLIDNPTNHQPPKFYLAPVNPLTNFASVSSFAMTAVPSSHRRSAECNG